MKTFSCILSSKTNPDKFLLATVTECVDMDVCIEHLQQTHPDHWIERIKPVPNDTA